MNFNSNLLLKNWSTSLPTQWTVWPTNCMAEFPAKRSNRKVVIYSR